MRQKLTAVLMMLCLLFTSCSAAENGMKDALAFRSVLQEHTGCEFTAVIATEISGRAYEFALACRSTNEGLTEATVVQPESIAGIRASMTETDTVIDFEGVTLDFGMPQENLTSPLYAPLVFSDGWNEGYIDSAGMDGDLLRITYRLGHDKEELILETWLRENVPVYCELFSEEKLILSAEVKDFTFLS